MLISGTIYWKNLQGMRSSKLSMLLRLSLRAGLRDSSCIAIYLTLTRKSLRSSTSRRPTFSRSTVRSSRNSRTLEGRKGICWSNSFSRCTIRSRTPTTYTGQMRKVVHSLSPILLNISQRCLSWLKACTSRLSSCKTSTLFFYQSSTLGTAWKSTKIYSSKTSKLSSKPKRNSSYFSPTRA